MTPIRRSERPITGPSRPRGATQSPPVGNGVLFGGPYDQTKVQSKTAYQKKSATSDREERTFDMHVRVEAKNQDMPAGTERILTLLENSIQQRTSHKLRTVGGPDCQGPRRSPGPGIRHTDSLRSFPGPRQGS